LRAVTKTIPANAAHSAICAVTLKSGSAGRAPAGEQADLFEDPIMLSSWALRREFVSAARSEGVQAAVQARCLSLSVSRRCSPEHPDTAGWRANNYTLSDVRPRGVAADDRPAASEVLPNPTRREAPQHASTRPVSRLSCWRCCYYVVIVGAVFF